MKRSGTRSKTLVAFVTLAAIGCGSDAGPGASDLEILSPRAGDQIIAGTRVEIEWQTSSEEPVDLWLTGPASGDIQIARAQPSTAGRGSYTWKVPLVVRQSAQSFAIRVAPSTTARLAQPPVEAAEGDAMVPVTVGAFASFRWNATAEVEEYYWVDVTTGGTAQVLGTVGDLHTWDTQARIDDVNHIIYVVGTTRTEQTKLYGIDAYTGMLRSSVAIDPTFPTSFFVGPGGRLIAFRFNPTLDREDIVEIDPVTGAITRQVATATWRDRTDTAFAIDKVRGKVYVLATNAGDTLRKLHTLDLATGAELSSTTYQRSGGGSIDYLLGLTTTSTGDLLAFHWNGMAEEMMRIDPSTGDCTAIGTVGDLYLWNGIATVNHSNDEAYVVGTNAGETNKLYVMDAQTGAFKYDVPIADWPSLPVIVY